MALRGIGVALLLSLLLPTGVSAQTRIPFLGVVPDDSDVDEADRALIRYLGRKLADSPNRVEIEYETLTSYIEAISPGGRPIDAASVVSPDGGARHVRDRGGIGCS